MKYFLLLLAAQAAVCIIPLQPTDSRVCIEDCTCKFSELFPNKLHVTTCNKPLVLNATTFRYVNTDIVNSISLENLFINQIQENVFSKFKTLNLVEVINTKIGSMDAKAFDNVLALKFQDCRFEDSPDLFSSNLQEVHFGSCNLLQIPNLNGLISLTFLNLTDNYIKNIEIEAFAELFDLAELHLANNEIFKLPPTSFINNQYLTLLNLDNNPLTQFSLNTSERLEQLFLRNCTLKSFNEESTRKLTSLYRLELSNNNINNINKALINMKELSVIDLSNNNLTKLDDNVFAGNSKLYRITLDGNNLQTLPNFYFENKRESFLYIFSCKYCNLTILSSSVFKHTKGMINLDLSHNSFKNVDNIFDNISTLKRLDISYNNIAYLPPQTFKNNYNLKTLNIAGNPLMSLNPETFAYNSLLQDIDARNASLKKLWSNYNKEIKSLRKILLSGNELRTLTEDDVKIMPKLEAIDLNLNPFFFNADLCMVLNHLEQNKIIAIKNMRTFNKGFERTFEENDDGFSKMEWKDFHHNICPDYHTIAPADTVDHKSKFDQKTEFKSEILDENDDDDDEYDEDDNDDEYTYDEVVNGETSTKLLNNDSSLAKTTYILSVTSVFVLSALVVLTIAVTITLCILRKNNGFEMQRANLPRLKIPLWNTTSGQKKHSGSVYRPLSEDLSCPKTPKLSRYDFSTTPVVHTA